MVIVNLCYDSISFMKKLFFLFYMLTMEKEDGETILLKGTFEDCTNELNNRAGFLVKKNPSTIRGITYTIYESKIFDKSLSNKEGDH
jgi:hypothetical protein